MAQVRSKRSTYSPRVKRVSPLKPGLRGARNWATAQVRAATYTRQGFWRLALSLTMVLLLIVFGALWLGGFLPDARKAGQDFRQSRLVAMGFVVDRVDVVGEGRIREDDVRMALDVHRGDFLFEMDMTTAQERVESLSWVDKAIVRRLWPDRIVVQIIERRPYALWQHEGNVQIVDKDGLAISETNIAQFAHLPLVVGPNAAQDMMQIHETLSRYPIIDARVAALVQLPSGRWDIRLKDGGRVKLPAERIDLALNRLTGLQQGKQIFDRGIAIIDVRLPDRLTLTAHRAEPV